MELFSVEVKLVYRVDNLDVNTLRFNKWLNVEAETSEDVYQKVYDYYQNKLKTNVNVSKTDKGLPKFHVRIIDIIELIK